MPRPLPVDYLQEDEQVLHQTGRHGLSVVDEAIAAAILAAVPITAVLVITLGFLPDLFVPLALPVIALVGGLFLVFLLTRWFRVATSVYTITDQRVYKAHGRLRFFLSQTTYDKLTDLHVRQSLFGRIWGFGTVRLETAGTGIALEGLRDPFGSKQRIESARSGFLRKLVGEGDTWRPVATDQTAADADDVAHAPPALGDDVLWSAAPSAASMLPNVLGLVVMLMFVGGGFALGAVAQRQFLLLPALLLVILALSGLGIWVRITYTRYHVARRGVFVTSGWLTRRRVETTYTKVTDVTVYQGVLGRMLDFGTITINTAGSNTAPVVFAGVARPETVKRLIDDTRRAGSRA